MSWWVTGKVSNRLKQVENWPYADSGYGQKYFRTLDEKRRKANDLINLNAFPDVCIEKVPRYVFEEIQKLLGCPMSLPASFTTESGLPELREAIARKLKRVNRMNADPDTDILPTVGAKEGLYITFQTLINPGDEIMIPRPNFVFHGMVELAGGVPVYVPTREENQWRLEAEEFRRRITGRTKIIIICNPVNPTGHLPTQKEIEEIVGIAEENNLIIVSDEAYEGYAYGGRQHTSVASLQDAYDRTITLFSLSKIHGISWCRMGYAVGNRSIMEHMKKLQRWLLIGLPVIEQKIAELVVSSKDDWVKDICRIVERRMTALKDGWNSIDGISCVEPEGSPYSFPNVSEFGMRSSELAEYLLREAEVVTAPGGAYLGEGHLRAIPAKSEEILQRGIERIRDALSRLPSRPS